MVLVTGLLHIGGPSLFYFRPSPGRLAMMGLSGLNVLADGALAVTVLLSTQDATWFAFGTLVAVNLAVFELFRRRDVADWSDRGRKP